MVEGLFRQSVFGRLAGYEDVNDAERLSLDPAMRAIVDRRGLESLPLMGGDSSAGSVELGVAVTRVRNAQRHRARPRHALVAGRHSNTNRTGVPDALEMMSP